MRWKWLHNHAEKSFAINNDNNYIHFHGNIPPCKWGQVRAVVEKVYPFEELPQALTKLSVGHNRGKTIVDYEL